MPIWEMCTISKTTKLLSKPNPKTTCSHSSCSAFVGLERQQLTAAVMELLMNLSLVVGFAFLVTQKLYWAVFATTFFIKYVVDYILLYQSNGYLRKGKFFMPIASSLVYPIFSSLVGIYSL